MKPGLAVIGITIFISMVGCSIPSPSKKSGPSPSEILKAVFNAANEERYSEANAGVTGFLTLYTDSQSKRVWDIFTKNGTITKIDINKEVPLEKGGGVNLAFTLHFKDGTKYFGHANVGKVDDKWVLGSAFLGDSILKEWREAKEGKLTPMP